MAASIDEYLITNYDTIIPPDQEIKFTLWDPDSNNFKDDYPYTPYTTPISPIDLNTKLTVNAEIGSKHYVINYDIYWLVDSLSFTDCDLYLSDHADTEAEWCYSCHGNLEVNGNNPTICYMIETIFSCRRKPVQFKYIRKNIKRVKILGYAEI
jgi:hypothetical protein